MMVEAQQAAPRLACEAVLAWCSSKSPPGLALCTAGGPSGKSTDLLSLVPPSSQSTSFHGEELSSPASSDAGETRRSIGSRLESLSFPKPVPHTTGLFAALSLEPASPVAVEPIAADVPVPTSLTKSAAVDKSPRKEPVGIWYSERPAGDESFQRCVFPAGVRVRLAPSLDVSAEVWRAMESTVTFVAWPPLPEGLSLDLRTGVIGGVVPVGQDQLSLHTITVYVPATCPGGISLGAVELTSCTLGIRVLDLQHFEQTWCQEEQCHDEKDQLAFKFQVSQ